MNTQVGVVVFLLLSLMAGARAEPFDETDDQEPDVTTERDLARARFEASTANVKDLDQSRLEAARMALAARTQEFLAGRCTLDVLSDAQARLAAARQALPPAGADRSVALESLWRSRWLAYDLTKAKYEAGRVSTGDYYDSLYLLRDVEIKLALSRKAKK